jgi:hypothetical protein
MFKSYQDTSSADQFKSFPNLNFQSAASAYGFSGVSFWLDAAFGLNTQTNLGAVSRWQARVGNSIFEQTTASAQPRLILNDSNYNNFPSVEATSVDRFMSAINGIRIVNGDISIAVISKITTSQQFNGILSNNTNIGPIGIIDGGTDVTATGFGYVGAGGLQGNTESLNPRIKILSKNNIVINGISEVSGTLSVTQELNRIFLLYTGRGHVGTIAEIIAFNYSMTSTDMIALSDRINQKYALY